MYISSLDPQDRVHFRTLKWVQGTEGNDMLTLDLQDLRSVKASTMTYPHSTMAGNGFATLRLEIETTTGDRLILTLFGETAEGLMETVEKAVANATMAVHGRAA